MPGVIKLTNERAWRTYIGGSLIDRLHGNEDGKDNHFPEEWIMSITECRNSGREDVKNEGMSRDVKSGKLLADIIGESAATLLGKAHYEKFGSTTGVLIKIIDSAERLSIQVHPDKAKAKQYFNSEYGKTESWHILGGREINGEKPCIYLGFKKGVTREYWQKMFDEQNISGMLDCLNRIEVNKGDTFLIKGGVPHALGAGCFLLEVQEPTDYTIRTERTTPSGFKIADEMCHQGIGFENMMDCFNYDGMDTQEIIKKYKLRSKTNGSNTVLISYDATPCFALDKIETDDSFLLDSEEVFYGLYVLEGEGKLAWGSEYESISAGDQLFVSAGTPLKVTARSKLTVAKFYGPKIREEA